MDRMVDMVSMDHPDHMEGMDSNSWIGDNETMLDYFINFTNSKTDGKIWLNLIFFIFL